MPNPNTVKIKPAPDIQVRKQDRSFLKPEGETVELNTYWIRRIQSQDVIEIKDEESENKTAGAAAGSKNTETGSKK